jgi:SOS-response transcriptional repressor LexA
LKSKFRARGGNDYVAYIDKLLKCKFRKNDDFFESKDYDFKLFDSAQEMIDCIKNKDKEFGLSRLVAGYSWPWVSKNKNIHDIEIDGIMLKWNSVKDDWVNSKNSVDEVGCIHTTQGYDLNYTGVIFGKEISYDKEKNENELKEFIVNIYKTILLRGIKGTYMYICDPNLREYFKEHVRVDKSEVDNKKNTLIFSEHLNNYVMLNVPMFESAGCGELLFADSTVQEIIPVRKDYMHAGSKYFVLRTSGDSMNKAGINNGDFVLCKKEYQTHEGDRVVALVGDDATIKEYHKENNGVILKPCSTNLNYKPLKFENEEDVKIIAVVVKVLDKN